MAQLILANTGNICLLDEEDYLRVHKLLWYEWHLPKQNTNYVRKKIDGKNILLHRFVMACPDHLFVDHIDGNGLDNRKENLRIVTKSQNNSNTKKRANATSKYSGVSWKSDRNKWVARGFHPLIKDYIHLGYFEFEIDAAQAYNEFCIKTNSHARLNLIKET